MKKEISEYMRKIRYAGSRSATEGSGVLLEKLGNPHTGQRIIHVAGTNGKGSVCSMLNSVLTAQGYRVGLYTSPYIVRFNERIQVNSEPISEDDIDCIFTEVKSAAEHVKIQPTEFDFITAAAFIYFKRCKCDVVILEVGLGGRYDSTNVCEKPLLSIITGISLDHTAVLGNTVEEIAYQKAGIIKENCPCLFGGIDKAAESVIRAECEKTNSAFTVTDRTQLEICSATLDGTEFEYRQKKYCISLLGEYQPHNAITVIEAVDILRQRGLAISDNSLVVGLKNAVWHARFEKLCDSPVVIFDGGHNPEGVAAAVKSVRMYFGDKKIRIITGVLRDKDYRAMAKVLAEIADTVYCVTPDSPRALPAEEYADIFSEYGVGSNVCDEKALIKSLTEGDNTPSLIIGSLYMYGKVIDIFSK